MARRRYQRGNLFLKRNRTGATWVARFYEDVVVDGVVRRIRRAEMLGDLKEYPTRRLALRALQERLATINSRMYRARPTATFADFAARWEATVLGQLKRSTAVNYRVHLRKHLVPFFGQYPMKELMPELVQLFVSQLKAAPKTVRNVMVTLQSLWRSARACGYVAHEVMDGIALAQPGRVERFFFSGEQVRRIVGAAREPESTFYGLLAETGLRVGELCALRVSDVDFERGLLFVRCSAWQGQLGTPKTESSVRVVELSRPGVEHLQTYLRSWRPNRDRLLFASRNGTPWRAGLLLKRRLRPLLRQLGIEVPRGNGFHAFRHANSTLMDRFGAPLKVRQNRLGHSDPRLTLGVYTHVASEDEHRVAEQLGEAVWGPSIQQLVPAEIKSEARSN